VTISAIVLAAGKGTRMKSELPKPLHQVRGRSLLAWVVDAFVDINLDGIAIVVGHGRDQVVQSLDASFDRSFLYAEQLSQRGTGDATSVGLAELDVYDNSFSDDDHVLVLPGDTPMLTSATMQALVEQHQQRGSAATVVTAIMDDPTGYGRVLRTDADSVAAIVEHRDADADQRSIREINGGIYCFKRSLLGPALRMIDNNNAQGEMYLTDAVGVLVEAGHQVDALIADGDEIAGVNDRAQLGDAAAVLGERIAQAHMRSGVTLMQPSSIMIDAGVTIEPDVIVHGSTVIEGTTSIAAGAVIGPNTHLVDATVGAGAIVRSSVVDGGVVAADAVVGPFAHVTRD